MFSFITIDLNSTDVFERHQMQVNCNGKKITFYSHYFVFILERRPLYIWENAQKHFLLFVGAGKAPIARNDPGIYFSSNKAYMYKIIKWNLSGAVYHRKWIWFFLRPIKTISTHSGACSSGWRSAACAQCATNPSCGSTLMPRRVPRVLWSQRKCEVGREETIPLLGKKTQLHLND